MLTVVRHKSGTIVIDIRFLFENDICQDAAKIMKKLLFHGSRCELDRIAIDAGGFDASM
jgi:hypothetical protein